MERFLCYYEWKFGKIGIEASSKGIHHIYFEEINSPYESKEIPIIKEAYHQLDEYFAGIRNKFTLPLVFDGTNFHQKVWKKLMEIPYGETRSYKDIALAIEHPKAYRAVGNANNKNPIPIIVPCHRVIGSNGKLVGYAGGMNIKEELLRIEQGTS